MSSDIFYKNDTVAVGLYAEILIPLALPKNYTWIVPASMTDSVHVGCRVEVNLGKNKNMRG